MNKKMGIIVAIALFIITTVTTVLILKSDLPTWFKVWYLVR